MSETVTVYIKSASAEDVNGDPVDVWVPTTIEGALVYELAGSDIVEADLPDGTRVSAKVQLPDESMAAFGRDALRGARIALTDRGQTLQDAFFVVGSPNYAPNLPTRWNTTISLGRVDG